MMEKKCFRIERLICLGIASSLINCKHRACERERGADKIIIEKLLI